MLTALRSWLASFGPEPVGRHEVRAHWDRDGNYCGVWVSATCPGGLDCHCDGVRPTVECPCGLWDYAGPGAADWLAEHEHATWPDPSFAALSDLWLAEPPF